MKLHLGCGKRHIPGFVHIDLDSFPHIDYQQDIRRLPMIKDNSVELIYFCHGIEYFDRFEIKSVLKEWKRTLAPGGILRLAVPDFAALAELYRKLDDLDKLIGPLYGRMKITSQKGDRYIYHRTVYDFASLKKLLQKSGFIDIRRYDWQKTIHKKYDDFSQAYVPHMDKENGTLISLNVEAINPD